MAFKLTKPEGIFVGLASLNLTKNSWRVQFDGGHDFHDLVDYGHGAEGTVVWMRFTVTQDNKPVVVEGEWDIAANTQTIKTGEPGGDLTVMTQEPFNGKPFIEPGFDGGHGSHVWLRYGVTPGDKTKEYRFQAPIHIDLGKLGNILSALGVIDPTHI
jgi:hypothetical protein